MSQASASYQGLVGFLCLSTGLVCALYARSQRPSRALRSDSLQRMLTRGNNMPLLYKLLDLGGFFGVDIGGTLSKIVFFLPDKELATRMLMRLAPQRSRQAEWGAKLHSVHQLAGFILSQDRYGATGVRDGELSLDLPELGGSFHFIRFETRRMEGALRLAAKHGLGAGMQQICTTGGGAHKFRKAAKDTLKVDLDPKDEIDCLVKGMAFLMAHSECESYTFEGERRIYRPSENICYPFILANVGSGAGFIVVHSETQWERVSGTSMGGGTFYGLCHLLTGETSFDSMLDGAEGGNNERVDLTVGDIYGGDYSKFGLKAATIAASFGKAVTWTHSGLAAAGAGVEAADAGGAEAGSAAAPSASSPAGALGRPPPSTASPHAEEDGSFRSVGKRSSAGSEGGSGFRSRGLSEKGLPGAAAAAAAAARAAVSTPVLRSWDPAAVLASAAAEELREGRKEEGEEEGEEGQAPHTAQPAPAAATGASGAAAAAAAGASPLRPRVVSTESPLSSAAGSAGSTASATGGSGSGAGEEGGEEGEAPSWQPSDAFRSLLIMISNNLGQLAYLNAVRYRCKHIYFAGNFLRTNNTVAMRTLAYAITFWSKGTMEGLFLRHEGYCGALGAFLCTLEQEVPPLAPR